ncbi:DNA metabolism protein [Capnocytophaga stomatis]|uniref:TIGR03915 family putative DNA repair protein n=1 Tax=Capnocytophaga stomatis TaxID=1848904 RepID=UPI00194FFDD6|nr:TIGR03915 family putative DNA repair protein [Capnocytophaga stomatis]GIJ94986.1 DNA metabolism protein [Capnocytophaga stomatis]
MVQMIYDGSFEGLLTAVFEVFEYKYDDVDIVDNQLVTDHLFAEKHFVITSSEKAERVVKGIEKYAGKTAVKMLLLVFLSENEIREKLILYAVKYLVQEKRNIFQNFADNYIMQISKIIKSVRREKHRMEAFVRFQQLQDSSFYAHIEPDFDVLPLIVPHFKSRYASQKWMIYDLRRAYGVYYDLEQIDFFVPDAQMKMNLHNPSHLLHEKEHNFELLWKNYFNSTNIKERRNKKLHLQHLPKRYWKYLTEKK